MASKKEKTPKAEKPAKAEVVKKEVPVVIKDTKNGVTRPRVNSKTGVVWLIADRNPSATREAVLKEATDKGVNIATASTQYGRWRKYNGLVTERVAKPAAAPVDNSAAAQCELNLETAGEGATDEDLDDEESLYEGDGSETDQDEELVDA